MKKQIIVLLILTSLFLLSCVAMKSDMILNDIKKNTKFTKKQVSYLLRKNGNSFYLYSSYATFSVVWTYNKDGIEIYRLSKGRVFRKDIFPEKAWIQDAEISVEEMNKEIYKKCFVVLDGEVFGFSINIDGKIHEDSYATGIDCMKQQTYSSEFLNKIVNDIKTFKMWEIVSQRE